MKIGVRKWRFPASAEQKPGFLLAASILRLTQEVQPTSMQVVTIKNTLLNDGSDME